MIYYKRLNKLSYGIKIKHYDVLFTPLSAYHPEDFENFIFEGWMALVIDGNFYIIIRPKNKSFPWHNFTWNEIFKKNWKYNGIKKEEYVCGEWYRMTYNFLQKTVYVQEANTGNKRWFSQ